MRVLDESKLAPVFADLAPGCRVVASGNAAVPWVLLRSLDASLSSYTLHMLNAPVGVPDREGVRLEGWFLGPGMRSSPRLHYVPARLSMVPLLFGSALPPDVVLVHTSVPEGGTVSLGTEVNVLPAAIEATRARGGLVIAQLDPLVPYVYGEGVLPLDMIDIGVEASEPLKLPPPVIDTDGTSRDVADQVARLIPDGSTIQVGIGLIPDAVLGALSKRRGLKVWTEMVSDGILALERTGALDRDVVMTASFLIGSEDLYAWADHNSRLRLMRTETTNNPANISANPGMVSVNTALQVDLFGQVNASRIHGRIYSGFGGQTDFIVGALHAPGGQSVIALRSWHPHANRSAIIPLVDEPVTSFQPSAIVTDQGVAQLWGHTEAEQARQLIEHAADPRVRDELWEEARHLGLAGSTAVRLRS